MRRLLPVLAVLVLVAAGCGDDDDGGSNDDGAAPTTTTEAEAPAAGGDGGGKCRTQAGPVFEVSAVDFQFKPACIEIRADQSLQVTNDGQALHNVSFDDVDSDIPAGEQFASEAIGGALEPGEYEMFCKYHQAGGMTATLKVVAA